MATKNLGNNADEFGDDEFDLAMMNFDVDAAVASRPMPAACITNTAAATASQPMKRKVVSPDIETSKSEKLQDSLTKFFGFESFRPGQELAIQAILETRDVAVFWATGRGKSICYQLPALITNRMTLVVSPLISLMQDQVHKLNALFSANVATYLGSAQMDSNEERKALNGEYLLVYVTPEKLLSSGFMDAISQGNNFCCIAVDESHCVSQWGHDFRPEYRQAGRALRQHHQLKNVPIIALTATAVPRIQNDIVTSLQLKNPLNLKQSNDRPNLYISVRIKDSSDPIRSAMETLVQSLEKQPKSYTIVYAPTRNDVEKLASFLQGRLEAQALNVKVSAYHAGMPNNTRSEVHQGFLTGKIAVVVATTAFGMGIDKPDIRRVVHFGPSSTFEDYYQQIGRAGRDGRPAECTMWFSPTDFAKYNSDFYIGKLEGEAKNAFLNSSNTLKEFCLNKECCRRKAMLDYFQQESLFGERCGTCDNCLSIAKYGDDTTRDFAQVARFILEAVNVLKEPAMTTIMKLLGDSTLEDWRFQNRGNHIAISNSIAQKRKALNRKVTSDQLKEFIAILIQKKYINEATKTSSYQRSSSYSVYSLGALGFGAIRPNNTQPIMLPVPDSIRKYEQQQEMKRQQLEANMKEKGLSLDMLPQEEVEALDGPTVRACTNWFNYVSRWKKGGRDVSHFEELFQRVETWRSRTAIQAVLAPAAVLAEHTMFSVLYLTATIPKGMSIEKASLVAVGIRSREIDSLVTSLNEWAKVHRSQPTDLEGEKSENNDLPMFFSPGPVKLSKWQYAVTKQGKSKKPPTWMASLNRFVANESPQTIALEQGEGKKPIQVPTVVNHLQQALVHGNSMDLSRLKKYTQFPTQCQWEQLEQAEAASGSSVVGDPITSGVNGDKFSMTECLRPIVGDEIADKNFKNRTEAEQQLFTTWSKRLGWYMVLKRVGIVPKFSVGPM